MVERGERLLDELGLACTQLVASSINDCVARGDGRLGLALEVEVGASFEEGLLGGLGADEHLRRDGHARSGKVRQGEAKPGLVRQGQTKSGLVRQGEAK